MLKILHIKASLRSEVSLGSHCDFESTLECRLLRLGDVMQKSILCPTYALLIMAMSLSVHATEPSSIGGLGLQVGTTGVVLDYVYDINPWLGVRAGYHAGSVSYNTTKSGIDYRVNVKTNLVSSMIDIKPFANNFRISAGVFSAPPDLKLGASGVRDYQIDVRTYRGDLNMDGRVDMGAAAPYVGIGWQSNPGKAGFSMTADMGVLVTQSPVISMNVTGHVCDATLMSCDPNGQTGFDVNDPYDPRAKQFRDSKDKEVQALQNDLKNYRFWPVATVGVHYSF